MLHIFGILERSTRISIETQMEVMEGLQGGFVGTMISVSTETGTGKIIIITNCEKSV